MIVRQGNKVSIIGAGNVGATTAYALLLSGLVSELVLVDLNRERAVGEAMDLSQGVPFCPPAAIRAGEYADCAGSDIVIITAGANQKPGETRVDLLHRNIAVFQSIVPEVVRHAPDAILLVVTNPVDVLTYVTYRLSGLPAGRVIGSGTVLDTSRLRYRLSEHTGVDARNIHSYILGEHGDTELAAWSLTTIAGMSMDEYCDDCGRCANRLFDVAKREIFEDVRRAGYEIIDRKGATYYAVALAVRRIVEALLRDERSILTVSSLLTGQFGLENLYLSLPAIVGAEGCVRVLPTPLSPEEEASLVHSGRTLRALLDEAAFE